VLEVPPVTRPLLAQVHHDRFIVLREDDEALDVEIGHVLLDARHGGELVQHAVDPRMLVTAVPGIEERRVRRRELPRM
jgi:hypothetical protein